MTIMLMMTTGVNEDGNEYIMMSDLGIAAIMISDLGLAAQGNKTRRGVLSQFDSRIVT